jgi:hypothetical protein
MPERRDERPPEVARQLRREAEYGCCRCGLPIYEYHHIISYSAIPHYKPEDMMILCPNAHDEATDGAFTEPEQRRTKANPYNVQRGYAGGFLKVSQPYCAISTGSTLLVGAGALVTIDGHNLLEVTLGDAGELQISVNLYGEDGTELAVIDRNEWISGSSVAWDIESGHRTLTIRQRKGVVSLRLDAKNEPAYLRARLWHNGSLVDLRPAGIFVNNGGLRTIASLAAVDHAIDCDTATGQVRVVPYGREGALVSEPDPIRRLIRATNKWKELHS